jgi:hypothetical protein
MSTKTTPRTIHTAAAELTAAGYETHITRDGWLCVYGPQTATAYWEAWFSPNDGNDVTVGDVPQAVFDLAHFRTDCPSCLGTVPAGAVDWGCYCNATEDEVDDLHAFMRLICD